MPNYHYRCDSCNRLSQIKLPISYDPKIKQACSSCDGLMTRIIKSKPRIKGFKVFAGDWFKKTYGHDIADGYKDSSRQKEDMDTLRRELGGEC